MKIFKCETPAIALDEFEIYIKKNYHLSEILKFMPEISNFQSQACKPSLERQKARQYDNLDFCTLIFLFLLEKTGTKLFFPKGPATFTQQGGRSCAGARVAPAEKFGLGRKF